VAAAVLGVRTQGSRALRQRGRGVFTGAAARVRGILGVCATDAWWNSRTIAARVWGSARAVIGEGTGSCGLRQRGAWPLHPLSRSEGGAADAGGAGRGEEQPRREVEGKADMRDPYVSDPGCRKGEGRVGAVGPQCGLCQFRGRPAGRIGQAGLDPGFGLDSS
jgi:hypothetical protein